MKRLLLSLLLLSLLVGCETPTKQSRFLPTPADGWERADVIRFDIDTIRQSGLYTISVGVRTSAVNAYPFSNLALRLTEIWEPLSAPREKLLSLRLTDSNDEISGKGVTLYQYEFPADTLRLRAGQSGQLLIRHRMKQQPLNGITELGIHLEKTD